MGPDLDGENLSKVWATKLCEAGQGGPKAASRNRQTRLSQKKTIKTVCFFDFWITGEKKLQVQEQKLQVQFLFGESWHPNFPTGQDNDLLPLSSTSQKSQ